MTAARVYCSFCGKSDREVAVMLAGAAAAFICDECVDLAVDQVADAIRKRSSDAAFEKLKTEAVRCAGCVPVPLRASEPHLEPAR